MINKKFVSILFAACIISMLSLFVFAKSVGGGEWTVGYKSGNIIYSRYEHETLSHGASIQVHNGSGWDIDRVCVKRGDVAYVEQEDNYRHTSNHGHGFWHRCGIEIKDCNGASGDFDY